MRGVLFAAPVRVRCWFGKQLFVASHVALDAVVQHVTELPCPANLLSKPSWTLAGGPLVLVGDIYMAHAWTHGPYLDLGRSPPD